MNNRAKSVVLIGTAWPYRGGLAAYNERLAKAFKDKGYLVEIYTFSMQYPSFLFPGKTQYADSPAPEGLVIHRAVNSINPLSWWWLGRKLRKARPDLVVIKFWIPFMGPCLGTIARFIRKNRFTSIISVIDNIIPHEAGPGDKLLARYFVRQMDGFVTMSQSVADDLMKFDQVKPRKFCPHPLFDNFGAAMERAAACNKLGLNPLQKHILFFGFIRNYKGLDLLLKAMAQLGDLPVHLVVAGEFYADSKPYLDLIDRLGIADRVILHTRFISDDEVSAYFSMADVVVQPYKTATQSGVTQIAYHFNRAMITTDVGGLAEIVPHGKVGYVTPPEVDPLAQAIRKYFVEDKRALFEAGVKEEKKKYAWERMTETIESLAFE